MRARQKKKKRKLNIGAKTFIYYGHSLLLPERMVQNKLKTKSRQLNQSHVSNSNRRQRSWICNKWRQRALGFRVGGSPTFSWLNSLMNSSSRRCCCCGCCWIGISSKGRGAWGQGMKPATASIEVYASDWPHVASNVEQQETGSWPPTPAHRLPPGFHVQLQSQQREICGWGIETNHLDWWLAFCCQVGSGQ